MNVKKRDDWGYNYLRKDKQSLCLISKLRPAKQPYHGVLEAFRVKGQANQLSVIPVHQRPVFLTPTPSLMEREFLQPAIVRTRKIAHSVMSIDT